MNIIKYYISLIMIFLLSGCMNTITHFWNNGFSMSDQKSKAYDYCMDNTTMNKNYDDFYKCLKEKGY
ncbi:hypothetical protein ACFQ3H_12905 [Paralysiella testudinis]|uniref:hypothetical protein n=1 Tax=Paralysiella testudinis TaxID=2809020 RepID=UPI0036357492